MNGPTALIADDEPLLRERLRAQLARLWPELQVVAEARNGREAVELFDAHRAAGRVPRRAHAGHERHRGGARDRRGARTSSSSPPTTSTRCRPSSRARSTTWSSRSTSRAWPTRCGACRSAWRGRAAPSPVAAGGGARRALSPTQLRRRGAARARWLQWIKASVGTERAPDPGRAGRLPALRREVHAGGVGGRRGADPQDDPRTRRRARPRALRADPPLGDRQPAPRERRCTRGANETAEVHLKGRSEVLPVSRSYVHLFRQM